MTIRPACIQPVPPDAMIIRPEAPGRFPIAPGQHLRNGFLAVMLAFWISGCVAHMGIKPAGLRDSYRQVNSSALLEAGASFNTKVVLHRYNMVEKFREDPRSALLALHEIFSGEDDRRDLRFALAELNFLYAEILENSEDAFDKLFAPDYFLTSALYAYSFLLGKSREAPPDPYDSRFRESCEFYNRALGKGLSTGKNGRLSLKEGVRKLPIGQLTLTINAKTLKWDLGWFEKILCADDYLVHGFTTRNRTAGLGVPLIAVKPKKDSVLGERVVPLTVFLRITSSREDLLKGSGSADLEFYSAYDDPKVEVEGQHVPLETDTTAPIAYALDNPDVWSLGLRRFLMLGEQIEPQILTVQPYERGRIPVVFVHGTASDMVWWAEMLNTLRGDSQVRRHYQFWFFRYNSNLPVLYSGAALRRILTEKRREFDPESVDPAMDQMVVIGHSQGGLLTKQTVVRTGDTIWRSVSDTPLDQMDIPPEGKELIRKWMFIEPLPFVKRVVFISTPHRGSFLAKHWVASIFRRIIGLPLNMIQGVASVTRVMSKLKLPYQLDGRPTSLDGMSPNNPILRVLADTPVASGVTAHSIIAVKGDGEPAEGDDGVVAYQSAHIEGVASEFIVRSGHSCQENPLTIEEVRRILLEHLASQHF